MSQPLPPSGLGLAPDQARSQQTSHSYMLAPMTGLPASASNPTPGSSFPAANVGLTQSSFLYNAINIPGLGGAVASAMPNGHPLVSAMGNPLSTIRMPPMPQVPPAPPGLASWAPHQQPSHVVAPRSASTSQTLPTTTTAAVSSANLQSAVKNNTRPTLRPAQSTPQFSVSIDAEEGELSEGQFEDLYEPDQPADNMGASASAPGIVKEKHPAKPKDILVTEFYHDGDEEEGEISSTAGANVDNGRRRSQSYSPHLSPNEIANDSPRIPRGPRNQAFNPAPRTLPLKPTGTTTEIPNTLLGMAAKPSSQPKRPLEGRPANGTNPQQPALRPSPSFRSLPEAKKEAQKVILGLLPMGVKYDQYLEAGFDETIIKCLFGDLHLDISKNTPPSPQTMAEQTSPAATKPQSLQAAPSAVSVPPDKEKEKAQPTMASSMQPSGKSEERKDRIARLLALKATKGPSSASAAPAPSPFVVKLDNATSTERAREPSEALPTSATLPTSAGLPTPAALPASAILPTTATVVPSPTSARPRSEKDLLLQQKLAALAKAREVQAKKVAQEKPKSGQADEQKVSPMASVPPVEKAAEAPQDVATGITAAAAPPPSAPAATGVQALPQPTPVIEASTLQSPRPTQLAFELSALPSPALLPPRPPTQRKRPVASDFVDYAATVGPPKRQFGQARHETSLIIDVTDDEDDSTDQEMDIDTDSPLDHPSSAMPTPRGGIGGPSIRDFPPLSDRNTSQWQFMSPTGFLGKGKNGKKDEAGLQEKEKAIQDMRRRIAEAEARRKAKASASVGQQTPNEVASFTPEPGAVQKLVVQTNGSALLLPNRSVSSPVTSSSYATPACETSLSPDSNPPALPASPGTETKAETTSEAPKLAESRRLLKVRSLTEKANARKGRILSIELPQVDERLEAKRLRLEQLREQQRMLEAELEQDLAAKQLLATELGDYVVSENQEPQLSSAEASSEEAHSPEELGGNESSRHDILDAHHAPAAPNSPVPEIEMEKEEEKMHPSIEKSSESPPKPTQSAEEADMMGENATDLQTSRDEASPVRPVAAAAKTSVADHPNNASDGGARSFGEANMTQSTNVNVQTEGTDVVMQESDHMVESLDDGELHNMSELYEPAMASPDPSVSPLSANLRDGYTVNGGVSFASAFLPPATNHQDSNAASQLAEDSRDPQAEASSREEPPAREEATAASARATSMPCSTFKPYQSPLLQFRAFRFHPDYKSVVAGGLKSLTYSHKIEPEKPLCPHELRGEACDEHCEFQHLRDIGVGDDQILVELGKAEDFGADQNRFIEGLRQVLHVFRDQNIWDFDVIARAIIDYRHQFTGDKTKVLPLHGVSI